jgi:zinc transporter ZupT
MGYYPFVLGAFTFFSTISGGLIAMKLKDRFSAIMALAAGVLIAVALLDLLPDSLRRAQEVGVSIENIMYALAGGFVVLFALERYFGVQRVLENNDYKNVRRTQGGWFGSTEIAIHAFVEGVSIGLAFHVNFHVGIVVAIAIISHDFCDGMNTVMVMLNSNNSKNNSRLMLILVAIAPLLGVASTLLFTLPGQYLALLLPFLAGGFLYLGAFNCLSEAYEKNPPRVTLLFLVFGFLIIFGISRVLN